MASDGLVAFLCVATLLALGLLHYLMDGPWLSGYAVIVDRAGAFMRRSRIRSAIEAVTGVVLIGLAVRLATAKR